MVRREEAKIHCLGGQF